MDKPRIIVLSGDQDDTFKWESDGWNDTKHADTKRAKSLMKKAHKTIETSKNVPDAIRRLRKAGFTVTRHLAHTRR